MPKIWLWGAVAVAAAGLLTSCPGSGGADPFNEEETIPLRVSMDSGFTGPARTGNPYTYRALVQGSTAGLQLSWTVEKKMGQQYIPVGIQGSEPALLVVFPLPGKYRVSVSLLQGTNILAADTRTFSVYEEVYDNSQPLYDPRQFILLPYQDKDSGGKWGYYDPRDNRIVIAPRFDEARKFTDGLGAVRMGDKWGYIDSSGALKIDADFAMAMEFSEERAAIALETSPGQWSWGIIDTVGRLIVEPAYQFIFPYRSGLARVGNDKDGDGYPDSLATVDRDGVIQGSR